MKIYFNDKPKDIIEACEMLLANSAMYQFECAMSHTKSEGERVSVQDGYGDGIHEEYSEWLQDRKKARNGLIRSSELLAKWLPVVAQRYSATESVWSG